ncbi:hypothetical protein M422DRAFT_26628 [Sphaerobolus stellatus SS14]|nr:hypothetical protein M422DRAFT_26628 [Sphaerobolus stellatus SS14]
MHRQRGPFQRVRAWGMPPCSYTPPFRLHPLTQRPPRTSTFGPSHRESQWYGFNV